MCLCVYIYFFRERDAHTSGKKIYKWQKSHQAVFAACSTLKSYSPHITMNPWFEFVPPQPHFKGTPAALRGDRTAVVSVIFPPLPHVLEHLITILYTH